MYFSNMYCKMLKFSELVGLSLSHFTLMTLFMHILYQLLNGNCLFYSNIHMK